MRVPSAGALVPLKGPDTPSHWLVPLRQALARVSPSAALERVTVLAAQPETLLWLQAEYASSNADPAVLAAPPPPDRVVAVQNGSPLPGSRPAAIDRALPYRGTQYGAQRPRKGALLDVRA